MDTTIPSSITATGSGSTVLRPAITVLLVMSIVTGILYPLVVAGVASAAFPDQAAGSLVVRDGKAVGSSLIGQNFADPGHFWGRPSATSPMPYNAGASSGSNLGPLNPALVEAVKARVAALRAADPSNTAPVPVDLVTASASGLDPDISPAAARYQAARVARVRNLPAGKVLALVDQTTDRPLWGVLGEARVNVLRLNMALEGER